MLREWMPSFRNSAKVGCSFATGVIVGATGRLYECIQDNGSEDERLCFSEKRTIVFAVVVELMWAGVLMAYAIYDDIVALGAKLDQYGHEGVVHIVGTDDHHADTNHHTH